MGLNKKLFHMHSLLNQLIAARAEGGSSYVTVHSPFGVLVTLSTYTKIFGSCVRLSFCKSNTMSSNLEQDKIITYLDHTYLTKVFRDFFFSDVLAQALNEDSVAFRAGGVIHSGGTAITT